MRTSFIVALLCAVALTVGVIGLLKGRSAMPASTSVAELPAHGHADSPSEERVTPRQAPVRPAPEMASVRTEVASPTPTSGEPEVETPAPPMPTPFSRAIDTLVSSEASFLEKQAALGQLQEAGKLEEAIEALAQGARKHPTSADYPAALAQAQLRKAGELAKNGGKISDMGILGMEADKNLDAALEIDPTHWEAQFFKAAAMAYWPLELNKGDEVIQRFSSLIDQQDTMVSQPEFAQTYVLLGDQYLKMNQPDYALATWQLGAQKYPGNPMLRQKLRGE